MGSEFAEPNQSAENVSGRIVTDQQLDELIRGIPGKFHPSTDREYPATAGMNFAEATHVDLKAVPNRTVVKVAGSNLAAFYDLEIVDNERGRAVYIWRGGRCLSGLPTGIISHDVNNKTITAEEGILRVDKAMHFPYFQIENEKLVKPKTSWVDTCVALRISTFE